MRSIREKPVSKTLRSLNQSSSDRSWQRSTFTGRQNAKQARTRSGARNCFRFRLASLIKSRGVIFRQVFHSTEGNKLHDIGQEGSRQYFRQFRGGILLPFFLFVFFPVYITPPSLPRGDVLLSLYLLRCYVARHLFVFPPPSPSA